jgi:hypothetical protein
MILIFHIVAAISSLIWTGYIYFRPSKIGLNVDYGLVAAMLISGFYLILSKPAHITQTCIEGLVYLAAVSYGIVHARNKLTSIKLD